MSGASRDSLFRAIVRGLYEGRYAPGQRLVEADLTAEYGVSRGTVRETLSRMAAEGIVTLSPGRGAAIRRLDWREAIDLLEVLEVLVGLAAARAARNAAGDGEGAARFGAAVAALAQFDPGQVTPEYALARDRFYREMTRLAGNAELARVTPRVQTHLLRIQFRAQVAAYDRLRHADYAEIGRLVLAGDEEGARALTQKHFRRMIEAMEAAPPG
ncbi:GntR family transcriptional regulator [Camelimonas abortus]|uniref:GntR family transcriptional regulator n=1 Tax=Camelimonas abortus TaxID=1017184 RepID=A0ABV7LBB0_9HYPH